jgi:hypothetical protein
MFSGVTSVQMNQAVVLSAFKPWNRSGGLSVARIEEHRSIGGGISAFGSAAIDQGRSLLGNEVDFCSAFKPWLFSEKVKGLLQHLSPGSWLITRDSDRPGVYKIAVRVAQTLWWYEIESKNPKAFTSLNKTLESVDKELMGLEVDLDDEALPLSERFDYVVLASYLDKNENLQKTPITFDSEKKLFNALCSCEIPKVASEMDLVLGPCLELPVSSLALVGGNCWQNMNRSDAENLLATSVDNTAVLGGSSFGSLEMRLMCRNGESIDNYLVVYNPYTACYEFSDGSQRTRSFNLFFDNFSSLRGLYQLKNPLRQIILFVWKMEKN